MTGRPEFPGFLGFPPQLFSFFERILENNTKEFWAGTKRGLRSLRVKCPKRRRSTRQPRRGRAESAGFRRMPMLMAR